MKRSILFFILFTLAIFAQATTTTYTFISKSWDSKVGVTKTDRKSDGWICDAEAYEYYEGYTDAQGRIYSCGVSVKTTTPNAGATSVIEFVNIRQITINYCQNSSKGAGIIHIQIGENAAHEIAISKPEQSGQGVYLKDAELVLETQETGKIRFWIECTQNAININTMTIRADNGSGNNALVSESTYSLVRNVLELGDTTEIMIGVFDYANKPQKVMGYYDENISRNNVHAIKGTYSADREMLKENENAVYYLIREDDYFLLVDDIRYENAYLVASGGTPNNYLTLWDIPESPSYGDFGHWDIAITADGAATIQSLGHSLSKIIQYNGTHDLFSCYQQESQTPVCIYKKSVSVPLSDPAIYATVLSFGEVVLTNDTICGSKNLAINAQLLNEDIALSLKHGEIFSLGQQKIDRDGDDVTINYCVTEAGFFVDTLICRSGETEFETEIMLRVYPQVSVNQVVAMEDLTKCYLREVVITKKYDKWVFVRDSTGSMLLYDNRSFAQGCKNGDVLSNVMGRYHNYFGVPEIELAMPFEVKENVSCQAELVEDIDSADVCRFVRLENVQIIGNSIQLANQVIPIYDLFNFGELADKTIYNIDAIVYITHDVLSLCPVNAEIVHTSGLDLIAENDEESAKYTILGQKVSADFQGIVVKKGKKYLQN